MAKCNDVITDSSEKIENETVVGCEYFFTLKDALASAEHISVGGNRLSTRTFSSVVTSVIDEYQIFGKETPLFYAINYTNGGFIIISADKRVSPILAYSNESFFDFDNEKPQGLVKWKDGISQLITEKRIRNEKQCNALVIEWDRFTESFGGISGFNLRSIPFLTSCPPDPNEEEASPFEEVTYEALISTNWGQDAPFNSLYA
jgi:hypothetical protein